MNNVENKRKIFYSIIVLMLTIFTTLILFCGCNKTIFVKFSFDNMSDIAIFNFDKEKYQVGETAKFTVTLNLKYSNSNFSVYANDDLVEKVDDKYTYTFNEENVNFEVKDYELNTYTYSLVNAEGFEIVADVTSIYYGSNFEFLISTEKYNENYTVLVNSAEIQKSNGKYIVENVCENLIIEVVNYSIKVFNITENLCNGIKITYDNNITNSINYGEDLFFEISFVTGYEKSADFAVFVNNIRVEETLGKYVVNNVTSNLNIVVTGADLKTCYINFEDANGLNVIGVNSVTFGDDYNFNFSVEEGYYLNTDFDILVNNKSIYELGVFNYTIENIEDDLTIKFVGIKRYEYSITYDLDTGFDINLSSNVVYYGESVTFTLLPLAGYYIDYDILYVEVNNIEISSIDNVFTISNIKENKNIVALNILLEEYFILSIPNGIEILLEDGTSVDEAQYFVTDTISFTINILDGYECLDNFELVCNTGNLCYIDGIYTLTNVTADIEFIANNLRYVGYKFNYENTSEYEIVIINQKDVYSVGDYFEFEVNLIDNSKTCVVYLNGSQINSTSGVYSYYIKSNSSFINYITVEIN